MKKIRDQCPTSAIIERLTHEGRGIARINGKTTFIEGALVGEEVLFTVKQQRGSYNVGQVQEILKPSPLRVTPRCAHYGQCGGCSLQHMENTAQLLSKELHLKELLQQAIGYLPKNFLPPLTGPHWGYRRKARLGVRYVFKKESLLVGFREKNGRYLAEIDSCEVLDPRVGQLITPLRQFINTLSIYREIPQVEVAISDNQAALIFRHLTEFSPEDLEKFAQFAEAHQLRIYLQPNGPDSVYLLYPQREDDLLSYTLPNFDLTLFFHPTDFTQINANINAQLVDLAINLLNPKGDETVLDLFCGLGNFTLPIATRAKQVTGVEGDPMMVERAQSNSMVNQIVNADFYSSNLMENFTQQPWAQKTYDKILIDPPRSGAFEIVQRIASFQANTIVYISCNPMTLARDAAELVLNQGYILDTAGVIDMFPQTSHVESIAVFKK